MFGSDGSVSLVVHVEMLSYGFLYSFQMMNVDSCIRDIKKHWNIELKALHQLSLHPNANLIISIILSSLTLNVSWIQVLSIFIGFVWFSIQLWSWIVVTRLFWISECCQGWFKVKTVNQKGFLNNTTSQSYLV